MVSIQAFPMQTLDVVYHHVFDVACFSHTLDHVGSRFNMPILHEFPVAGLVPFPRAQR